MLLCNVTVLFQNYHDVEASPSQCQELKRATLQLLHSPSVPEEESQANKKTSAIVIEEKSFRMCTKQNDSFVGLLLYT